MQPPQPLQRCRSTVAVLRPKPSARSVTRVKAWSGQAATQRPQPVQVAAIWSGECSLFMLCSKIQVTFDEFFDDANLPLQFVVAILQLDDLVPDP